jgi:predicted dehydrogenase
VSYQKCDAAIAMAKEKGLLFGVDFDLHFRGPLSELKLAADGGFFGERIISANITLNIRRTQDYYNENGKWRGTWALDGGGALSNQGIHEIDRLITILGVPDEVRTVTATQTFDIEAEDYGVTEWRYQNGTTARLAVTTSYNPSSWYCRVEVYGRDGAYLNVSGGPEGNHIYWYKDDKWTENAPFPYEREWQQGSDNFAYCLRMGGGLVVTPERGRDARYVLDKVYESARQGGAWVKVGL